VSVFLFFSCFCCIVKSMLYVHVCVCVCYVTYLANKLDIKRYRDISVVGIWSISTLQVRASRVTSVAIDQLRAIARAYTCR